MRPVVTNRNAASNRVTVMPVANTSHSTQGRNPPVVPGTGTESERRGEAVIGGTGKAGPQTLADVAVSEALDPRYFGADPTGTTGAGYNFEKVIILAITRTDL